MVLIDNKFDTCTLLAQENDYHELAEGDFISIPPKDSSQVTRYLAGGTLFGLGWALTGACPGPLFTLAGAGYGIILVPIASAIAGTWVYGVLRPRLPH